MSTILRRLKYRSVQALLILFVLIPMPFSAEADDFSQMSLEELVSLDITSVSKKPEPASQAAAAVYVISNEDIRRSGATTLWDALRLAPGVHVAKLNSHTPAVTIRGHNDVNQSSMLVLQDGRTIYDPVIAGVTWRFHDVVFEDIERIEIIRGPGSTLWGTNAQQGIINIITKDSANTQGLLASGGGGSYEQGFGTIRYGGEIGSSTSYRAWFKGNNRDSFDSTLGTSLDDDWWRLRTGFRSDSDLSEVDTLTLSGDATHGEDNILVDLDSFSGLVPEDAFADKSTQESNLAHIMAHWTHSLGKESDLQLQTYYEHVTGDYTAFKQKRDTFDIDFQHRFPIALSHDVVWGLNYRFHSDSFDDSELVTYHPLSRDHDWVSGFIQNDITLIEDELRLTLGIKLSDNDFTGFDYQPTVRSSWTPTETTTLWGAITRAVRVTSRSEEDIDSIVSTIQSDTPGGLPNIIRLIGGGSNFEGSYLWNYELGFRQQVKENFYLDLTGHYYIAKDGTSGELVDVSFNPDPDFPRIDTTLTLENNLTYEAYGAELALEYRPVKDLRLVGTYTYTGLSAYGSNTTDRCDGAPTSTPVACQNEETLPNHIFGIRSNLNLPHDIQFDAFLLWVDSLLGRGMPRYKVDSYAILDLRLGWRPKKNLELSVVGQNLLEDGHVEWVQDSFALPQPPAEVPRGVYAKITWEIP